MSEMAKFNVGDQVRLINRLPITKANRDIAEKTQGQILEINKDGYVVQFIDSKTAIEGITDDEIEADT
jgi:hypothetical protein